MSQSHTIRTASAEDAETIEAIAVAAGMFGPEDVGFLGDLLRRAEAQDPNACWLVLEVDRAVEAAAYYAPEPFADRMWNLYFIAVRPEHHGRGLGRALMAHIEGALRERGDAAARTLIVETSSTTQYERTRRFYRLLGYDEEARIRQFYGPKDDKVVFWKSLVESPSSGPTE